MSIRLKVLWQTCILLLTITALVTAELFPEEIETDEMENEGKTTELKPNAIAQNC
jgi:hypothetical protein